MTDMQNASKGFNTDAKEFIPGLNKDAPAFVPNFGLSRPINLNAIPTQVAAPIDKPPLPPPPTIINQPVEKPINIEESWENETPIVKEIEKMSIDEIEQNGKQTEKPKPNLPVQQKPKTEEIVNRKPAEIEEIFVDPNRKESVNLVFIGHVDAGKSTIGGHLLYLSGMVDKRTLEKYEREAKEKNRESWYLSWALDTNQEERDKGKTVECGRGFFETEKKHFTLLDAPGHKSFVPNMISGAAQADLALLVISARRGEFETGFEKGGQTREHAMLVKTAGTKHLIVLINKMDDPTVEWSYERYKECVDKLIPYLKSCGFNPKNDIHFMPCSGFTGAWLKDSVSADICPWYRGPPLLTYLDDLPSMKRATKAPLRLPIADRYKDMGTYVIGKIESGGLVKGQRLLMMPNRQSVEVAQVLSDDVEVENAIAGDNVKVKLKNIEEEDISSGFVLCNELSPCQVGSAFDAQVVIQEYKSIICSGYTAVIHLHCCVEEVTLEKIYYTTDKKTGKKKQIHPRFIKQEDMAVVRFQVNGGSICMETFKDYPQMGRFTLRDEGRTIAMGKILKVVSSIVEKVPAISGGDLGSSDANAIAEVQQ